MIRTNIASSAVLATLLLWLIVDDDARASPNTVELAEQVFTIENMTCAACPITVKRAMSRVSGVHRVDVNFEDKTATATYDRSLTNVGAMADASTAVGFPARVQRDTRDE